MTPPTTSERLHATAVAIDGRGALITGRSGSGKSDLALRLIDRGATLVADDVVLAVRVADRLVARPVAGADGRMEVRGLGIVAVDALAEVPVTLLIDLDGDGERLPPDGERRHLAGVAVPVLRLDARAASAPIKVEWALARVT